MSVCDAEAGDGHREAVDPDRAPLAEHKLIVVGPADAVKRLGADAVD